MSPVRITAILVPPVYSTALSWTVVQPGEGRQATWSSSIQPSFQDSQPVYCGAGPPIRPIRSQPPTYRCWSVPVKAYRSGRPKVWPVSWSAIFGPQYHMSWPKVTAHLIRVPFAVTPLVVGS